MSDTPETDAEREGTDYDYYLDGYVSANLAAKLERQRNALLEALKEAARLYSNNMLVANSIECGKWINNARKAIEEAEK